MLAQLQNLTPTLGAELLDGDVPLGMILLAPSPAATAAILDSSDATLGLLASLFAIKARNAKPFLEIFGAKGAFAECA